MMLRFFITCAHAPICYYYALSLIPADVFAMLSCRFSPAADDAAYFSARLTPTPPLFYIFSSFD